MIQKYLFNPGIFREGTEYDAEGGWFDCNLIRFRAGRPEKIGGWQKLIDSTHQGTVRALHNWIQNSGTKTLGLGSHLKYYVSIDDAYNDITPIRETTSAGDVTFAATNGSTTITVSDNSHSCVLNDFVTFSGAVSLGGVITAAILNAEHQITRIVDANSYEIVVSVAANSSDTGNGGSSVVGTYQINVGLDDFIQGTGWGSNPWGDGGWGSTSSLSSTNQLRLWTHDNFGEDLIIAPRGGSIYKWDASAGVGTRAALLSGLGGASKVPTKALQVITSETDRHLIVLGADPISGSSRTGVLDPMLVAFSDQENELEFNPTTTNTAGSVRLSSGSQIIGAVKSRQEVVIFTDTSLYSMQFVGPPFTFAINLIDNATGLIAPKAAVTAPGGVYFMSYDSFYVYSGQVAKLPCAVKNYVFSDINTDQAFKIFEFSNKQHNEIGWYYPSGNSDEIDRYVIYNYQDNLWYYGQLARFSWLDTGVEPYPQATGSNYLYQHEFGYDDDGSEMQNVYIESGDFDIEDGNQFSFMSRIIPDIKFIANSAGGNVNFVTKVRNYPGDSLSTAATSTISSTTQQSFIRARGRQAVLRIQSNDGDSGNIGTGWRLGATRFDVRTDGRR